jgi:hypothetical protein
VTGLWDVEGHFKEVYLIKTDENGYEEWSQAFGHEESTAIGYSLKKTSDGGVILSGFMTGLNDVDSDVYLVKTD